MLVELSDADLLARLRNFEDHFVERKTVKDEGDWKKTTVAFANSAPVGYPAVLYIGARDNGEIETPQKNLDDVERKFNVIMQKVYPPIAYVPKVIRDENGGQVLAVIVQGSEFRPHFAGLSYVRNGSQSDAASDSQFAELIAQRNSKAARILAWKTKRISVVDRQPWRPGTGSAENRWPNAVVADCDQFYVTLQRVITEPPTSVPLSRIEINFDNLRGCLQLEIML